MAHNCSSALIREENQNDLSYTTDKWPGCKARFKVAAYEIEFEDNLRLGQFVGIGTKFDSLVYRY